MEIGLSFEQISSILSLGKTDESVDACKFGDGTSRPCEWKHDAISYLPPKMQEQICEK